MSWQNRILDSWTRWSQSRAHRAVALMTAICLTARVLSGTEVGQPSSNRPGSPKLPRRRLPPRGVLNINTASEAQWQRFPGIGPALAHRIRKTQQQTPFKTVDELQRVRGIGPRFLSRFQAQLRITGPTSLTRSEP